MLAVRCWVHQVMVSTHDPRPSKMRIWCFTEGYYQEQTCAGSMGLSEQNQSTAGARPPCWAPTREGLPAGELLL
jgi:hypothetical protein